MRFNPVYPRLMRFGPHRGKEELGAGGLQFGLQPRGVEFAPLTHPFFVGIVFAESSPVLLDLAAQLVQFGPDALQLRFHLDLLHPQFLETGPQLLAAFEPVLVLLLRLLMKQKNDWPSKQCGHNLKNYGNLRRK